MWEPGLHWDKRVGGKEQAMGTDHGTFKKSVKGKRHKMANGAAGLSSHSAWLKAGEKEPEERALFKVRGNNDN